MGCLCVAAALAIGAWFLMREPQLIDHAERVTNVTSYAWIDDHTLLWMMPNSTHIARIDLRRRGQTLDFGTYTASNSSGLTNMLLRSAAPGGHRAIAALERATESGSPCYPFSIIIDLDKTVRTRQSAREYGSGYTPAWLPDGRRWLALAEADSKNDDQQDPPFAVWLYSADTPGRRVGPVPIPKDVRSIVGLTPDSRLVLADRMPGSSQPMVNVWTRGFYPNSAPETHASLSAPPGWRLVDAALSPSGDQIAWLLTSTRIPPLLAFAARFLPALSKNVKPTTSYQIRTTHLDGGDVREVGFQDAGKDNQAISQLQWNPDGKRVSFVFGDSLFLAPVGR